MLTGVFIIFTLFLNLEMLIKAASAVILTTYILSNVALIILRESRIQNYQPSFKAPFYPWVQIISIILYFILIFDMGLNAIVICFIGVFLGAILYFLYGKKYAQQEYALIHVIQRITNKELTTSVNLETELREVLHQRDEITHDKIDHLIQNALVFDIKDHLTLNEFFEIISEELAETIKMSKNSLSKLFKKREAESSTAITPYLAIPHIIIKGKDKFHLAIVRVKHGIEFTSQFDKVKAVFILLGSKDNRNFHLQVLSAIAGIVQSSDFEEKWKKARSESNLKDILLLGERKRF